MKKLENLKKRLYIIIFEAETWEGRLFDIILLFLILISIVAVMLESVKTLNAKYGQTLEDLEYFITILFTIEYFLRIWISPIKKKYIFSFYGIIDFLSILPLYLSFLFTSSTALLMIRTLRLLRVFRILGLSKYQRESQKILNALKASRTKIAVFLYAVLVIVIILGTLMYIVEGEENGFTSIPRSIYWAIVTITTVGYGDIAPQTTVGQFIAGLLMIIGYSIIAVPTGIVTVEISKQNKKVKKCKICGFEEDDPKAKFCKYCGNKFE